jgi:hypothetical protein
MPSPHEKKLLRIARILAKSIRKQRDMGCAENAEAELELLAEIKAQLRDMK